MPTWLIFIILLSILVLVHELGHFLAARILGIKVEEFALGLPFTKPLVKIQRGEIQYAVYPVFFGGFVKLYGEDKEPEGVKADKKDIGRDFWSRGKKQRIAVIAAGVVMNVVLAVGGFVLLYSVVGVPRKTIQKVTVAGVEMDSPAQEAGITENDRIVEVEGKTIGSVDEFSELMRAWGGLDVNLTLERGSGTPLFEGIVEGEIQRQILSVVPRKNPPEGKGALGVMISAYPYLTTEKCSMTNVQCSIGALEQGFKSTKIWIDRVFEGLRGIGGSLVRGKAPEGVSGPFGIYQLTDTVAAYGWLPILELLAILSINLAVFNILPIPALDGGRMFFVGLEWLMQKRIPAETEQKINSWGMAFLITLMVLVSLQDVIRLGVMERIF